MLEKLKNSVSTETIKKGLIVLGVVLGVAVAGAVVYHYSTLEEEIAPVETEPPFETE